MGIGYGRVFARYPELLPACELSACQLHTHASYPHGSLLAQELARTGATRVLYMVHATEMQSVTFLEDKRAQEHIHTLASTFYAHLQQRPDRMETSRKCNTRTAP